MLTEAMIAAIAAVQAVPAPADAQLPVIGPVLPAEKPARSTKLDVAQQAVECTARQDGEIVVCAARDGEGDRLRPLPEEPAPEGLPRAELMIGDVNAVAVAESEVMPRGDIGKRLMLHFTLPF